MPRRTERMEFIANMLWNSDEKFGDLIGRTIVFWLFLALFSLSLLLGDGFLQLGAYGLY